MVYICVHVGQHKNEVTFIKFWHKLVHGRKVYNVNWYKFMLRGGEAFEMVALVLQKRYILSAIKNIKHNK